MQHPARQALFSRLMRYVLPYWKVFALGVLGMVLYAATEAALPLLMKHLLDGSFAQKNPQAPYVTPLLLIGLFLARGITDYMHTASLAAVAARLVMDLRVQMFEKILRLPTGYFESTTQAELITRFTFNTNQISPIITVTLITLVKDSLTVVGLLAYMLWMDWQLSLAFFTVLPLIAWIIRSVSKRMRDLSKKQQGRMGNLSHILDEAISGQREIKIFGAEQYESSRFRGVANNIRQHTTKVVNTAAANGPIVQLIAVTALAAIVYYATMQSAEEGMSVGDFVSFFTAMALLLSPLKRLSNVNETLQRGLAAAESIFELLDAPEEVDTGTKPLPPSTGHIRFEQVSFHYANSERPALVNLDLDVRPGETLALVGASGSGKSTLVSLIPRFHTPDSGRILIDGHDIRDVRLTDLRANIGLVTQHVVLFDDTVAANIAYGRPLEGNEAAIRQAAKAAHATEFIERMPEGFNTLIGENGSRLSGGQRQRLSIARALLKDAPILLLDEATSALDTESERAVQEALDNLRKGRTTIIIAHRLSTIVNADRIVVLDQGRIAEIGTHAELLAQGGPYSNLYRMQFGDDAAS